MITKEICRDKFPKTYKSFSEWFKQEGWGAESVDDLSEYGWNEWFPDFLRHNDFATVEELEYGKVNEE